MSSQSDQNVIFTFDDNSELLISKDTIIDISTTFYYKNINNNKEKIIKVPKYIGYNDLDNFIKLFQRYISRLREFNFDESFISVKFLLEKYTINISKLLQISEYFESDSFSIILIKDCLLSENKIENINNININQRMNIDNAIILLYLSYNKLKDINNISKENDGNRDKIKIEEELETTWLDLFIKSIEMIGQNLNYYFENNDINDYKSNKLWGFDKKIIDELYDKFSYNLVRKNFIININEMELDSELDKNCIDLKELNKIIYFLMQKRNQNDFFDLLSIEFMKIISEENINEISSLPNPTFTLKINTNEIDNYYEEFPIDTIFNLNDNIKIIVIVYYKKNEDTFHVALKLTKYKNEQIHTSFDILTFLSLAIIEEINNKQINVKSLSNNKSMYEIFKINNFKNLISLKNSKKNSEPIKNEYLTFKLFVKPCFIYTMLTNYLLYNLDNLYNNKNISKISKNLLNILIQKKQLIKNEKSNMDSDKNIKYNNADKIAKCLINWLNDEINIGEDISEIIKIIQWEYVSLPLLFEFLIKFSIHIISDDIEYIFSKSLSRILKKYNGDINILSQEIIHSIVLSSKKMNYISIFCENKKIKKFNLYELMNQRRNIPFQLNDINNIDNEKENINNNNNLYTEKNYSNEKNKSASKDNSNYDKIEENQIKKKTKNENNNSSKVTKYLHNSHNNNNISIINNNGIFYNNFFTHCNNSYNINIKLNDKIKNISNKNKKKVIISQIKIRKNNNNNNIQYIKRNNITPNKKGKLINTTFYTPKLRGNLNKFDSDNILNNTINFKNLKNLDKILMKNKYNRIKSKNNINKSNNSENKIKTDSSQGYSYFRKTYQSNKKEHNVDNYCCKNDKNKKHISLLNELLKLNKKGKKLSSFPINKKYLNNKSCSLKLKKLNLTQINIDNKYIKDNGS